MTEGGLLIFLGILILFVIIVAVIAVVAAVSGAAAAIADQHKEEEKRKIYQITDLGKEVLELELKRINRLYRNAQEAAP